MKSIILILPYFGKWPIWFEAHLCSINKNPTVSWLIITDCLLPEKYPENIKFIHTSLSELNEKINEIVEVTVPLTTRKFCDLKPAYGAIFSEHIEQYDFWGFCDMDIIWGDIRKFITNEILESFDIISSRKGAISGHFNLFRNNSSLNNLYKDVPNYKQLFEESKLRRFDEIVLTDYIKSQITENNFDYQVYWSSILLNQERGIDSRQQYYLDRWMWFNGTMLNTKSNKEVMYLHFINWKKTMKMCEVNSFHFPEFFYISFSGINYSQHANYEISLNAFKNLFDGYYNRLWRYNTKKEIKNFMKKIKTKLKQN